MGARVDRGGAWTRDKVALLAYYLPRFAKLCTDKAGGWYYLDGFAGKGANRIRGWGLSKGTALVGVLTEPFAKAALLIEKNEPDYLILAERTAPYRDRVVVSHGDANLLISEEINQFRDRNLPALCVLDPEGLELDWQTIETCATRRRVGTPYELLVYFSTPSAARSAGVREPEMAAHNERRLKRLFGNEHWREIADRQRSGSLRPGDAGKRYLELYQRQIQELGYTTVLSRAAIRQDGNLVYHLVFASANQAGENIMRYAMGRAFGGQMPLQF